jgi:hypothetical protein
MRFNKEYNSLGEAVDLKVHTKSPTKWILVDRETGETYQGNDNGSWDRLDPVIKD